MAADDRELAKKCAFDARTLLNDMQGNATATRAGMCDHVCRLALLQLRVLPRRSRGYI
jgi:hypothetical protein